MLQTKILSIFLFFFSISSFAQISGTVKDANTGEALAFVNVVYGNMQGTTTGIDGKFLIKNNKVETLEISYLGYKSQIVDVNKQKDKLRIIIKLVPTAYNIDEVVIFPGVNPAHRIIKKAVENKKQNRPESLDAFEYTTYNKLIFTFEFGIIDGNDTINSLDTTKEILSLRDSTLLKAQEFKEKQHLFMMEAVSKRKFKNPDKSTEKVIASRVSGLKNPTFTLLATQMQSLTFYDDYIKIMDKNYLSPISKGSTSRYFFLIADTIYTSKDTVFVISFRPRKGKKFDGLKGIIHINTNGYAIQSVKATPYDEDASVYVKIQQNYKKVDEKQWFPTQLNTDLKFKNINASIDTLSFAIVGIGKTYIRDIELNPEVKNKEFNHIAFDIDDDAAKRDEEFWNYYRQDTLTKQELKTYAVIDSIGDSLHFDKKLETYSALFQGYFPVGYININLSKLLDYNEFEGFQAGLGLTTSRKVSKLFLLGGYLRYGFRDYFIKYGGNIDFHINKDNQIDLKLHYYNDVAESGGYNFYGKKYSIFNSSSSEDFRKLLIKDMYRTEAANAELHFRAFRYLKAKVFAEYSLDEITNNYYFTFPISTTNNVELEGIKTYFYHAKAGLKLKYAYKEKFAKSEYGLISLGTKYPIIYANITFGSSAFNSDLVYTKYEAMITKSFTIRNFGITSLSVKAGYTADDIPYIYLYNGYGSYYPFTIEAQNTFGTMRMNEFLSSKFAYLFFRHNFKSLLFKTKWFQPQLVVITNIGLGNLEHKKSHNNIQFNTMEKAYYESGLLINNILKLQYTSLGVGVFYRYGPYALDKNIDNFAFKLSFAYSL